MEILAQVYDNGINRFKTHCCALTQLSINNDHTLEEIQSVIDERKKEALEFMDFHQQMNYGTNERAVFVITISRETKLIENLQKLGFKEIAEFHRRNYLPEDSMLKMWLLSW